MLDAIIEASDESSAMRKAGVPLGDLPKRLFRDGDREGGLFWESSRGIALAEAVGTLESLSLIENDDVKRPLATGAVRWKPSRAGREFTPRTSAVWASIRTVKLTGDEKELLQTVNEMSQVYDTDHAMLRPVERSTVQNSLRWGSDPDRLPAAASTLARDEFLLSIPWLGGGTYQATYDGLVWQMKQPRIFISYDTRELELADYVRASLRRRLPEGATVFVAKRDIGPGDHPGKVMLEQQLLEADALVALCSSRSKTSHWLWWEAAAVWARGKPVFPLFINVGAEEFGPPLTLVCQGRPMFVAEGLIEVLNGCLRAVGADGSGVSLSEDEKAALMRLRSVYAAPGDGHR
ncbi:MAG TPA: toll/interleukin-1 receptor domain-containing protein [Chloroflexota bacterium]|nr:toll/interleukin-1 receptor domain-containing protein [Chloroflexota bacterium]